MMNKGFTVDTLRKDGKDMSDFESDVVSAAIHNRLDILNIRKALETMGMAIGRALETRGAKPINHTITTQEQIENELREWAKRSFADLDIDIKLNLEHEP